MRPPPVFNSRSPRQCLPAIDLGRILYVPSFSDLNDRVKAHPPSAYNIIALYVGPPKKSPPQETFLSQQEKTPHHTVPPKKAPGTLPPSGSTHPGTRADKYPPTQSPAPGSEEQPHRVNASSKTTEYPPLVPHHRHPQPIYTVGEKPGHASEQFPHWATQLGRGRFSWVAG